MSKKVYVLLEIIKIFVIAGLIEAYSLFFAFHSDSAMAELGYSFLMMLITMIVLSIILDILLSIFTPKEKNSLGEWEKLIDKNVTRNFSYSLSIFFIAVMIAFALQASPEQIILLFRVGFLLLIATTNLTKAYYYAG